MEREMHALHGMHFSLPGKGHQLRKQNAEQKPLLSYRIKPHRFNRRVYTQLLQLQNLRILFRLPDRKHLRSSHITH